MTGRTNMLSAVTRAIRREPVALAAVVLATAGSSYAAISLPAGSVGTQQLKRGAVTLAKIATGTQAKLRGPRGPQGPAGNAGPPGATGGPGEAVQRIVTVPVSMPNAGAATNASNITDIDSINLTPGAWVITANVNVVNLYTGKDIFRCTLAPPGKDEGPSAATVQIGGDNFVSTISPTLAVQSATDFAVRLRCWHDTDLTQNPPTAHVPYTDPGATIIATRVGSLVGQ